MLLFPRKERKWQLPLLNARKTVLVSHLQLENRLIVAMFVGKKKEIEAETQPRENWRTDHREHR